MEGKYNRKVMIANKPIHSHNRGPNQSLIPIVFMTTNSVMVIHSKGVPRDNS